MEEVSALHLSFIVANHHLPHRLLSRVPAAKAGAHAQQLAAFDTETSCRGIIYLPNKFLNAVSSRVLKLAERARNAIVFSPEEANSRYGGESGLSSGVSQIRRGSGHRRRSSTMAADDSQVAITAELDRARSRIQSQAIENTGHQTDDIWRVAFKMLIIGRQIQPQTAVQPRALPPAPRPKPQIIRTLEIPGLTPKKPNPWVCSPFLRLLRTVTRSRGRVRPS